ncbi:guanine nucleotide exchange factor DSS4 NDAI_0B02400 [Naumovozyma dairenensis CBS 421]|uniref:Protein DSS4 n=1 Tax=Naumovozyma dairenensis (strain ATCC 10597 / BCRC 20456 / CBS 421 / NBRC 0211 / NRRL Y-12639) TaxID=1071378 RepID=G0W664_NAUDC|nr:hypothetical protein NDAI_0B02400 [Naumovozyma dairenensis CBS 421]CCD23275.1 hypothetical protein NDAI_0B02400 [Naumovozyma dairenensis CBS 421]
MVKAICSFEDCRGTIATASKTRTISLPNTVFEKFQLLERREKSAQSQEKHDFLIVEDVWDFDNIGVSRNIRPENDDDPRIEITDENLDEVVTFEHNGNTWTIEKCTRYLICAECDKGPIGIVCQVKNDKGEEKVVYLLSLSSLQLV